MPKTSQKSRDLISFAQKHDGRSQLHVEKLNKNHAARIGGVVSEAGTRLITFPYSSFMDGSRFLLDELSTTSLN